MDPFNMIRITGVADDVFELKRNEIDTLCLFYRHPIDVPTTELYVLFKIKKKI